MFLNRPKQAPQQQVRRFPQSQQRKYNTILKIRLPQVKGKSTLEQNAVLVQAFREVLRMLFVIRNSLIVHAWHENLKSNSIRSKSVTPNNWDVLNLYTQSVCLMEGKYLYTWILMGHKVLRTRFEMTQAQTNFMISEMSLTMKLT